MHQNVLKIRNFEKVNISDYDQTRHRFNFNNNINTIELIINEYRKNVFFLLTFLINIICIKEKIKNIENIISLWYVAKKQEINANT